MKYYETPEFIKLQKEVYKKLEESGFKDMENYDENMQPYEAGYMNGISMADIAATYSEETVRYYELVGQWVWFRLRDHGWKLNTPWWRDRIAILRMHADGESWRAIQRKLGVSAYKILKTLRREDPESEIGQMLHAVRYGLPPFDGESE